MLVKEEEEHKDEIIMLTEEVLHAQGLKCDASIAKVSEAELRQILEKVRELRKKKKKTPSTDVMAHEREEEVSCVQ